MSLNDNLKTHLKKMHEASATDSYTFANPAHPLVSSLFNQNYLVADHATADPTDEKKIAFALSPTGLAELGLAPAGESVVQTGSQGDQEGDREGYTDTVTEKVSQGRGGPRGPRVAPVIHQSGRRMAVPEPVVGVVGSGGRGGEVYPFTGLQPPEKDAAGQAQCDSFFVAKTENNPYPKKKLAGTISGANKRFKHEGRKFTAVEVETDHEFGKPGVRVLRIA